MLKGFVNDNEEPVVPIQLILQTKPRRFSAIVDTGFNGFLNVPRDLVRKSRWYFAGVEEYEIATGECVQQQVYVGNVIFDGEKLQLYIVTSNSKDILIGTKLLKSNVLTIDFLSRRVVIR